MPIVTICSHSVNSEMDAQAVYTLGISWLKPKDVPCIYCHFPVTHAHGTYDRRPFTFDDQRELWDIHRRFCPSPDCGRTFGLLPSILAPYARFVIVAQDIAVADLSHGSTYEQTAIRMDEKGVFLSESTLRRWFCRMQEQIPQMLPLLSSLLQNQEPDRRLPTLRNHVRDTNIYTYYDRLKLWGGAHSGEWNLLRRIICLFAPPLSGNRVSYGLSPG